MFEMVTSNAPSTVMKISVNLKSPEWTAAERSIMLRMIELLDPWPIYRFFVASSRWKAFVLKCPYVIVIFGTVMLLICSRT
jgi:hypothetical protein